MQGQDYPVLLSLPSHPIESSPVPAVLTVPKFVSTLAVAAMIAVSLVACGSPSTESACEVTPTGSHSESVKVSGDFGKEPKVTMPASFEVKKTERTVLIKGTGESAASGQTVSGDYAVYNAKTGEAIRLDNVVTWSAIELPLNESLKGTFPGLYSTLLCSHKGDRIVSAVPSSELFGLVGTDMSGVGIGATDTVVFIFDVSKIEDTPEPTPEPTVEPTSAPLSLPTPTPWVDNVPIVDLSGDIPSVTIPTTDPPAELQVKVIEEGTGAVVEGTSTASVTVDYQGTSWNTGEVFDQSYTRGAPSTFPVGGVVQGFAAAMVGQKVGSIVLVTIPPEYAYGPAGAGHKFSGQTLVFLIEIRDTK